MTEVATTIEPPKESASNIAEGHISTRRQVLNERLVRWGKMFIGGNLVSIAGALLFPVAPPVGATLAIGGGLVGEVGFFGILGNVVKRVRKKNR
jgi:hypothetical protein